MTSKKSLKIKYLLVIVLLLIAIGSAFRLGTVFADEKTDAQALINDKYNTTKTIVDVTPYNGNAVLDSYKDKADWHLSQVGTVEYDGSYDDVKNVFFAECELLTNIVNEGNRLVTHVNGLAEGNYLTENWEKIQGIKEETLEFFDITKLYDGGNLNVDYVRGKVDSAISKINAVEQKPTAEDLTEYRTQAKNAMQVRLNAFKNSGVYSDTVKSGMDADYTDYCEKIDAASDETDIDTVKGQFFSKLETYPTVIEETASDFDEFNKNNPDKPYGFDISKVEIALSVYENVLNVEDRTQAIDSDYRLLLTYYGNAQVEKVEARCKDIKNQYSYKNYSKITQRIEELRNEIKACADKNAVNDAINNANAFIGSVAKNVRVIRTQGGKYNVEIEANKDYAFSPEAYVKVTDYTFYAVKKNVNRLLKKVDTGDDDKKYAVKYYLNVNVIDEDGKKLTSVEGVTFTVKIYDSSITQSLKDDNLLKVVYYYNGSMEGFNSEDKTLEDKFPSSIENEGEYLMFTTTHFSPFAICGTGSLADTFGFKDGPVYKNPFFYVAIILVLIILILLITLIVKTWKYKITFKTNGGSKVKKIKAKKNEPFVMPAVPTKAGYMFGGWFKDKECKNRFILYKLSKRKNVKVYAKWIPLGDAPIIEESSVTVDDLYKALRTALDDYQKVGFGIGLSKREEIGRIIISNDKVNVYLKGDVEKYEAMGYELSVANVDEVKETPMRITVKDEEQLYKALELIDLVMAENGFSEKEGDVNDFEDITEEERLDGYVFAIENDVEATTLKDFFEVMRMEAKSYVLMGDSGTPRDMNGKYIVKAKMSDDKIDLYLPYDNGEAVDVSDDALYKDVPARYEVTDKETLIAALKVIQESMTRIGMKKYPRNASLMKQSGEASNAFGYRIRFN